MCLDTQHCKLYLSHGVMSCVHMLCMCGRMWNVDCISWSMCACLCLLFMHAVQLHISCKFVCAVCGALCVSSMCVCECVCVYVDHWLHWHEHEQMDQWTCSDANHERPLFVAHKLKKDCLGQQKRLLARQSILQRRFLPMCQNAHSKKMVVALMGHLLCFLCKCNCSSPLFDLAT